VVRQLSAAFTIAALFCAAPAPAQTAGQLDALQTFGGRFAAGEMGAARTLGEPLAASLTLDVPLQIRADLGRQLAAAQAATGAPAEAAASLGGAIALLEAQWGADHPDLVPLLEARAAYLADAGDFAMAEALLTRAAELGSRAYGEGHASVLATLEQLRAVQLRAGRTQAADDTGRLVEARSQRSRAPPPTRGDRRTERRYLAEQGAATVRVFYGTNRQPTRDPRPARFYGPERGELQYGHVDVTIPETHRQGELETQSRWSLLTLFADDTEARRRYVLLQRVLPLPAAQFAQALRAEVGGQRLKEAFVFVHGFNCSFEDAARRTAQLAYDLDFDGVPLFYSWPSQASTTSYIVDEAAVNVSGRRMAEFLETVMTQSGAQRVHLIAHSMGNRALIEAMQAYLAKRAPAQRSKLFGQVVFTAPDVDRDYFLDAVNELRPAAERVTLYASDNDLALKTSQKLHGAPRAGLAGASIISLAGMDTIDMSGIEADLLGHSYFAVNSGAIYDLFRLLWRSDPPPRRCGLSAEGTGAQPVWRFNVTQCAGSDLLHAGVLFKRFGDRARNRVRSRLKQISDPDQKQEWTRILNRLDQLLPGGA
jgi:esterase/lipase superfamily enzyme